MHQDTSTEILKVNEPFVLGKCDYFVDVQLWPLIQRLNPKRWLSNFRPAEMDHAISLLNAFLYFDRILMDQLLWVRSRTSVDSSVELVNRSLARSSNGGLL